MKYTVREPTQQELVERIKARAGEDVLNTEVPDYAVYLDREHVEQALPSISKSVLSRWTQGQWSEDDVLKRIRDYLPKAFEWANGERDMETLRAMSHFVAWTWVLGDVAFSKIIESLPWDHYGKPHFRLVAERYGVNWREHDDGKLLSMPELDTHLTADGGILLGMDGKPMKDAPSPMVEHESIESMLDEAWGKPKKHSPS